VFAYLTIGEAVDGLVLGQYTYELDGIGKPRVVTESLLSPILVNTTKQFLESSR